MHQPPHFRVEDRAALHAFIAAHPLGLLISHDGEKPVADLAPFHLDTDAGSDGRLRAQVEALTQGHEGKRQHEWRVDDAPDDFIAAQLRAIVGFEIKEMNGKFKLSQNRSAADRASVVEARDGEGRSGSDVAAMMRENSAV